MHTIVNTKGQVCKHCASPDFYAFGLEMKCCECGQPLLSGDEEKSKDFGVNMEYIRISKTRTKFFYSSKKDFKELEFCIDFDPETEKASLWIRPGYTDALPDFICDLLHDVLD